MTTEETFIKMALSFPGTEQRPHFERIGFKVIGKRMFATYLAENNTANVFLTPEEQAIFCRKDAANIYPVPNKWGEKGATTFELDTVPEEFLNEALISAYNDVLMPKTKKVRKMNRKL
jgi:predicted DNA-binding protein (MmcQ/YjbR family)